MLQGKGEVRRRLPPCVRNREFALVWVPIECCLSRFFDKAAKVRAGGECDLGSLPLIRHRPSNAGFRVLFRPSPLGLMFGMAPKAR